MADTYFEIAGIRTMVDNQQGRHFITIVHGPTGTVEVPTTVESLLDYYSFQREFLLRMGFMYRLEGCEGRDGLTANSNWKGHVQEQLLRTHQTQQAPPPEAGGTMMN